MGYAAAVADIGMRMAPVHRALAEASVRDTDCAALRAEISARRANNMRPFAADLRPDLTDDEVADIVWSMKRRRVPGTPGGGAGLDRRAVRALARRRLDPAAADLTAARAVRTFARFKGNADIRQLGQMIATYVL